MTQTFGGGREALIKVLFSLLLFQKKKKIKPSRCKCENVSLVFVLWLFLKPGSQSLPVWLTLSFPESNLQRIGKFSLTFLEFFSSGSSTILWVLIWEKIMKTLHSTWSKQENMRLRNLRVLNFLSHGILSWDKQTLMSQLQPQTSDINFRENVFKYRSGQGHSTPRTHLSVLGVTCLSSAFPMRKFIAQFIITWNCLPGSSHLCFVDF